MIATDFEYNGEYLKNYGFIICDSSDQNGFNSVDSDSQFSFNSVKLMNGKLHQLTTSQYDDRIEIQFQICKQPSKAMLTPISVYESREIKRWLNSPEYKKFKLMQPNWGDIYMEGSFNVRDIKFSGETYFLELTFISNRPFALHEPVTMKIHTHSPNESYSFFDISDEIGYIYPDVKIKCLQDGDLKIVNSNENRTTIMKNCVSGEILTFTKEFILSSSKNHKIQNDFNYIFFRISNSYKNRKNILTFSLPVEATITYSPYVKAVS